jgi:GNAT superfamily N-acetyltransferase
VTSKAPDPTHIIVRPATNEHAKAIANVHVRTWQGAYEHVFPLEGLASLSIEDREQAWGQAIASPSPRSHIFVAEGEVGVSGFASFGPTRDSDDDPEQVGELYAIYVLPEAWGKGVGRTLMAKLLEHLRADGFRESTLWVLADNPRTRHFYEVAGWKVDGSARQAVHLAVEVEEVRYRIKLR